MGAARTVRVPVSFWEDTITWHWHEQFVAFFLLTCPAREHGREGLMQADLATVIHWLAEKWDEQEVRAAFAGLERRGFVIADDGWMFVPLILDVDYPRGPSQVRGAEKRLRAASRTNRAWEAFAAALPLVCPALAAEMAYVEGHGPRPVSRSKSAPRPSVKAFAPLLAFPCAYCGGRSEVLDHIVPFSDGGTSEGGLNLVGACVACNNRKGAKPLLHFLLERSNA